MTDDLHRPKRTKGRYAAEHEVILPGANIRIYKRRADGFTRIEVEEYHVALIVLYVNDEELTTIVRTFAAAAGIGTLA